MKLPILRPTAGWCLLITLFACEHATADDVVLQCRVVDSSGNPIAAAKASVRSIGSRSEQTLEWPESLKAMTLTDSGVCTTETLKSGRSYVIEAAAAGYAPDFSRRSHPEDTGIIRLPDLVLRKLRTVTGRVTDSGHPDDSNANGLEGVVISQSGDGPLRTETTSDKNGRFALPDVPEGLAVVFAEKPGFWFRGIRAPAADQTLHIQLSPRDQPNPERCDLTKLRPTIDSPPQPTAASVAVLEREIRSQVTAGRRPVWQWAQLATLDEPKAMELLESLTVPDTQKTQYLQSLINLGVSRDFENAVARLHGLNSGADRLTTLTYYLLRNAELADDQRAVLLSDAVLELRSLNNPVQRTQFLAALLPKLHRSGQQATAQQLIEDTIQILAEGGESEAVQQQFGSLAEAIAKYDPDRALELQKKSPPNYGAWIAYGIATDRPGAAVELIRNYQFSGTGGSRLGRWYNLPRVCYRLAQTDVDAALEIAELIRGIVEETVRFKSDAPADNRSKSLFEALQQTVSDNTGGIFLNKGDPKTDPVVVLMRARIHALIAQAAAAREPERARLILEHAAIEIETATGGVRNLRGGFLYPRSLFMATLIPAAAEFDPGLAAELCWRMLAIRAPISGLDTADTESRDITLTMLPAFIATLDNPLAVELLQHISDRGRRQSWSGREPFWSFYAWSAIDANHVNQFIRSICDRGVDGEPSVQDKLSIQAEAAASETAALYQKTIMQQAEVWLNEILWTSQITNDTD